MSGFAHALGLPAGVCVSLQMRSLSAHVYRTSQYIVWLVSWPRLPASVFVSPQMQHLSAHVYKIDTHCEHVSTAMLTKCVGEAMGKLIRNNQVQVAEVLPRYAKGTGQQGVC